MASIMTGWTTLDSFSLFLLYFLIGHRARTRIFILADYVAARPVVALAGLTAWGVGEEIGVQSGVTEIPGITVLFGVAGAFAVVTLAALMANWRLAPLLAYCGCRSLFIYLAFVLPMAATRLFLLKMGLLTSVGWISIIVAVVAIAAPLMLEAGVRGRGSRSSSAAPFGRASRVLKVANDQLARSIGSEHENILRVNAKGTALGDRVDTGDVTLTRNTAFCSSSEKSRFKEIRHLVCTELA